MSIAAIALRPENQVPQAQIQQLQAACLAKHVEQGEFVSKLISVALIVVSVATVFLIEGFLGLVIGASLYVVGGHAVHKFYTRKRNRDYLDAAKALSTEQFQTYTRAAAIVPTMENIQILYQKYKKKAARLP